MNKICILTTSLGNGGAEKCGGQLSILFTSLGYDVHIVIKKDLKDYDYSGTLYNLEQELKSGSNTRSKTLILYSYLKRNKFDLIVDNRSSVNGFLKELILYKHFFRSAKIITMVHSYNYENYSLKNRFFINVLYKNIYKIVTVSEKLKNKIKDTYSFNNIERIYNHVDVNDITIKASQPINFSEKYILFYGRIDDKVKNLSLLLEGYKLSRLPKNKIRLVILGSGNDYAHLNKKVRALALTESVVFIPFTTNPFPYVKNAILTVLTSRYEGFPLVLIESLACKTPVISVNCNSGPDEIIKDRYNGLLIKNHDKKALASSLNELVENKDLYALCKQNAQQSIKHLALQNIALQWKELLDKAI